MTRWTLINERHACRTLLYNSLSFLRLYLAVLHLNWNSNRRHATTKSVEKAFKLKKLKYEQGKATVTEVKGPPKDFGKFIWQTIYHKQIYSFFVHYDVINWLDVLWKWIIVPFVSIDYFIELTSQ